MPSFPTAIAAEGTARALSRWDIANQFLAAALLQIPDFSELYASKKTSVFNMLWALVFGFATLNILGLVLRRFEPRRSGLNFGELLAIAVVILSVLLLGLEMLGVFHILPIRLTRH
jgi:cytosine/uracil/thiamine/allantoin permease